MPPSLARNWGMPNKDRSFHESPQKAGGRVVYSEQAVALSLQVRHGDRAFAVGRHQDLQLRSALPTRADDSAAVVAAQRH